MKKIFIIIIIVVGALLVLFNRQTEVHVQRSAIINASTETVRTEITDFRKFRTWSPWTHLDTEATSKFSEIQGQVGAKFFWEGNDKVGTGSQEVISMSDNRINIKLTFTEPWTSESQVYYELEPVERGTSLTWGYNGEIPFMISLFQDMDHMLGGQYEAGLKKLQFKYQK